MANDFEDDSRLATPRPTPAEARAALSGLGADGARLAERVVTPGWYHPTLGAIVALICCTQALPFPASAAFLPVALFALPALVLVYRRRYGIWIAGPAGPRSRRLQRTMGLLVVLSFGAALVVKYSALDYAWVVLPAAVSFVAAVSLGRRYDDALRDELARPGGERG